MTGAPVEAAVSGPGGFLGTKIVPPSIPGGFMRRPRLEDRLDLGVTGPVTLVSAARNPARFARPFGLRGLHTPGTTCDGSAWPPDQNTTSG